MKTNEELLHEILLKIKAGNWLGCRGICSAVMTHQSSSSPQGYEKVSVKRLQAIIVAWLKDKRYKHPDNVTVRYPVGGEWEYADNLRSLKERHANPRRVQLLDYMIRATAPRKRRRRSKTEQ